MLKPECRNNVNLEARMMIRHTERMTDSSRPICANPRQSADSSFLIPSFAGNPARWAIKKQTKAIAAKRLKYAKRKGRKTGCKPAHSAPLDSFFVVLCFSWPRFSAVAATGAWATSRLLLRASQDPGTDRPQKTPEGTKRERTRTSKHCECRSSNVETMTNTEARMSIPDSPDERLRGATTEKGL